MGGSIGNGGEAKGFRINGIIIVSTEVVPSLVSTTSLKRKRNDKDLNASSITSEGDDTSDIDKKF